MSECYSCGKGNLVKKKVDFKVYGVSLGRFDAEVCGNCGETYFDEDVSDKIDAIAKKKGLWGLEATTKVGKVGNSIDIKLNKRIADFAGLKKGEEVRIYPEGKNKIIIES
jgi:YgiT-type zinc finger domain-containing protein